MVGQAFESGVDEVERKCIYKHNFIEGRGRGAGSTSSQRAVVYIPSLGFGCKPPRWKLLLDWTVSHAG